MRGDDAYAILKKKIEKNQTQPGTTPEQAAQIKQNKEDITTLKKEVNKKIAKIYASNQGEMHLENSDDGQIQNMFIYGKSEQKQYSGKNLLNYDAWKDTLIVRGTAIYENNGITLAATRNDCYTEMDLGTGFPDNAKIEVSEGETLTLSWEEIENKSGYIYIFGNGIASNGIYVNNRGSKKLSYTVPSGITFITFRFGVDTAGDTISYKNIQIEKGSEPTAFELYTGGIPSPNPSYPQEIKNVVNPTVKVCGKNLLNATLQTTTKNGVTCTNNGDGTYTLNGTATAIAAFDIAQDVFCSSFRLIGCPVEGIHDTSYELQARTNNLIYGYDTGDGKNIKAYEKFFIRIRINAGTTCNNLIFKPMIVDAEKYPDATYDDFEPYHEQTVTLPYDLYGVKVPSGGNVTIDGQQYVSDYFDVERGKLVRMVDDVEAKNYTWDLYPNGNNMPRRFGMNDTIRFNMPADIRIMSSYFKQIASNTRTDLSTWFQTYYIAITDMNEKWKNSEALIQWFSENNVHFYLPLKTPIEIDLTPEEIQALKALATYYPATNISVNSEQLDGYTVFNYPLPFEDEWNNVKQQVNDIKKDYLTKEDAEKEYQPKGDYATKTEIKEGYQQKGDYLTKTEADDKYQTKAEAAEEKATVIDMIYKDKVAAATTKAEVDTLFAEWWKSQYDSDTYSKSDMLERWFGNVLVDNRVHGVKTPLYTKSTSMIGELTDDSAGLVCTPSTETVAGNDPFDHLPQFWCLEVSAEKQADGSHVVYYVEHIDSIDDVRSGEHLCWVLQKNTWKREWKDSEYKYLKMQCKEAEGYKRWPEGKDRTGKIHEYMAHPKYPGGMKDGLITCGTGLAPVNRTSHTNIVAKWRARGKQYSGGSGSLVKFLDIMMRLKYGKKGNSGTIEGCTNYNFQYTVAVSETGVERIILTKAQAANLFVGSAIMLGIQSGTDRNTASNYSIFDGKLITKIEDVTINDTVYSAVYVDNGGKTFNTTAGSTYMSTSPYYSGWNDNVKGRDGSRYNYNNGKEPGMLQGVEFMHGSYIIVSDELWQWGTDADGNYTFDCFKCYDQSKVSSEITNDYVKMDVPTLKFPQGTASWVWKYITDNAINDDVMWPETTDASGSGVGVGAGFYCVPASSGVRAAWVFGILGYGGIGGVPCRVSGFGPSTAYWYGSSGAPGSEG